MPLAVLFPGQGAAAPGAGRSWRDHPAWRVVNEAETKLDRDLEHLLLDADGDELLSTGASQLAVFLVSLMAWDAVAERLVAHHDAPVAFAGHSLGQITAIAAANMLDRADAFRLAGTRADACQRSADETPGRMVALLGCTREQADAVCARVDRAWVANDNAPGQIVIAGTSDALAEAVALARLEGVRRASPLPVGHAFHTPMLQDAAVELNPTLQAISWSAPIAPVVTNHDALAVADADGWPERLTRHLIEPVEWRRSIEGLHSRGVDTFLEVGPGRVLSGLVKRIVPDAVTLNVSEPSHLAALDAHLEQATDRTEQTDAHARALLATTGGVGR